MPVRTILLTAFEPSGDALAASLVDALKHRDPDMRFVGLGGPRMRASGVELLESTTEHAVMLTGVAGQALVHQRRLGVIADFLRDRRIVAHVPVDSAAANWSICARVRLHQSNAKIVHLVLPQIWAWAGWRIHRLRRLTDHVLCILPFEPDYLAANDVPGTFVGHPLLHPVTGACSRVSDGATALPGGTGVKVAVLPGSRAGVIRRNLPTMLEAARRLQATHQDAAFAVVAADQRAADAASELVAAVRWPGEAPALAEHVDNTLAWADAVLVNSGTATLHVAAHRKPMVVMYNVDRLQWSLLGRWLIRTRTFSLPNVIAEAQWGERVVPEFVPHFGDPAPVAGALEQVLADTAARDRQIDRLCAVCGLFEGLPFGDTAADTLLSVLSKQ